MQRGIALLGGLDRFVRAGEQILLKPNLLAAEPPEKAITTHPSLLEASARLLVEVGARCSYGDSPGRDTPGHAARGCGMLEAAKCCGIEMADFVTGEPLAVQPVEGVEVQYESSYPIARGVHRSDGLINLAKAKSHQLTRLTLAVKNLYGCIPGPRKALYHVQYQDVHEFSGMLCEMVRCLPVRLHVIDAVVAMEGNGPRSGDPRHMGLLLFSKDPIALDATFCRLVDLDPEIVPTNPAGAEVGLGRYAEDEIEIVGEALEAVKDADFKMIRRPVAENTSYAHYNWIKRLVLARPVIDAEACIRCGQCVSACPVPDKALRFDRGRKEPPIYHYELCIRCYCCHEMCPQRAIHTQRPLLGRIMGLA
jgi:uncharacterized protein (DUF362 family)/NAD-dependent dihydropyrimidine dehydrogenase PreA subunit